MLSGKGILDRPGGFAGEGSGEHGLAVLRLQQRLAVVFLVPASSTEQGSDLDRRGAARRTLTTSDGPDAPPPAMMGLSETPSAKVISAVSSSSESSSIPSTVARWPPASTDWIPITSAGESAIARMSARLVVTGQVS